MLLLFFKEHPSRSALCFDISVKLSPFAVKSMFWLRSGQITLQEITYPDLVEARTGHPSLVPTLRKTINHFPHFPSLPGLNNSKTCNNEHAFYGYCKILLFYEGAPKNVYEVVLFYEKMVCRETLCSKQLL